MSIIINRGGHIGFTLTGNSLNITDSTGTPDYLCGAYITTLTTISAGAMYPNGTTFNANESYSSAVLNIPSGSSIHKAYLVWTLSSNVSDTTADVDLIAPDGTKYTISPDFSDSYEDFVLNSSNISGQISNHLSGLYTVGNLSGPTLSNGSLAISNSWYIAVVYENISEPLRYITGKIELFPIASPSTEYTYKFINFPGTATAGNPKQYYFSTSNFGNLYNGSSMAIGTTLPAETLLGGKNTCSYLNPNNIISGNILTCDINDDNFLKLDTRGTFGEHNKKTFNSSLPIPFARTNFNMFCADVSDIVPTNESNLYITTSSNSEDNFKPIYTTGHFYLTDIVYSDLSKATLILNKPYVTRGDTITYLLSIPNTGNGNAASNVVIVNAIPNGTTFVSGSVMINGCSNLSATPNIINLECIGANELVTISFDVAVNNIPTSKELMNTTIISYQHKTLANLPFETFNVALNALSTINCVDLLSSKISNKNYSFVGDTITYTIPITNIGTTATKSLFLMETLPRGASFISGSLMQDKKVIDGTPGDFGVNLNNLGPNSTTTVTYDILIEELPPTNSISNYATINFSYAIDPFTTPEISGLGISETNISLTTIVDVILDAEKHVDKPYIGLDDILTYSISILNSGNAPTNSLEFSEKLPNTVTFIENSFTQDGVSITGNPNDGGIILNNISANTTSTISYCVKVIDAPTPNIIECCSYIKYDYIIDSTTKPNILGNNSISTNSTLTTVNYLELSTSKTVCRAYADVGYILTYTIPISNKGNTSTNSITLIDNISDGATFVEGSLIQDNVEIKGTPINIGVALNNISPNTTSTVSFKVKVDSIPSTNLISSSATAIFDYIVDPANNSLGLGSIDTNITLTTISTSNLYATAKANKDFASIGDNITYTLSIKNTGNTVTDSVLFIDTLPDGITFVTNSLNQDGVDINNDTYSPGVILNNIQPNSVSTISFKGLVTSIPKLNATENFGEIHYSYVIDNTDYSKVTNNASLSTNVITTTLVHVNLLSHKEVDMIFADVGSTLTYNVILTNNGTTITNSITFIDTIPEGVSFVQGSLTQDGISIDGSPNAPGVTLNNISPHAKSTVSYKLKIDKIPSSNIICSSAYTAFDYIIDPTSNIFGTNFTKTNITLTTVSAANLSSIKIVDKPYANLGDIVTYTISVNNTGITDSNNILLVDTLPNGFTFVENSLIQDGVIIPSTSLLSGITLNNIEAGSTSTLSFKALVTSIPTPNIAINQSELHYSYVIDDTTSQKLLGYSSVATNVVATTISHVDLITSKEVDAKFADIGATLTYNIILTNTGTTTTNSIIFIDTIPVGMILVENSLKQDGIIIAGSPNIPGVTLNNIAPNMTSTISYKVKVDYIPTDNSVYSCASTRFDYIVDPNLNTFGTGYANTNITLTTLSSAILSITESVDTAYADIGDFLTYTITINNSGNTSTDNVLFIDTLPTGITLVPNSITQDGITILGNITYPGIELNNIQAASVSTVSFKALVTSMTLSNTVKNFGELHYSYIIDNHLPYILNGNKTINTKVMTTTLTHIELLSHEKVDIPYTDLGNILTYDIALTNNGTTITNSILFIDTIPEGTSFIEGSFTQGGTKIKGNPTPPGIILNNISPNMTSTVSFKVKVDSIPSNNSVSNYATVIFDYVIDPTLKNLGLGSTKTNILLTTVSASTLSVVETVDKEYSTLGDILTYTLVITNTGNIATQNILFVNTLPNGITLVDNSLNQDNISILGTLDSPGVVLNNVEANSISTVSFKALVTSIPTSNSIISCGEVHYSYVINNTVSPCVIGKNSQITNMVATNLAYVELLIHEKVDQHFADIESILTYNVALTNKRTTKTNSILFIDTIPEGMTYLTGSLSQDGTKLLGSPNPPGITLQNIDTNTTSTVSFKVRVDSIPSANVFSNSGTAIFDYVIDPVNNLLASDSVNTNITLTTIATSILSVTKKADKTFADIGDTITYTLPIVNNGNIPTNSILLLDKIPSGTIFVENSLTQDDIMIAGNPTLGVILENIDANTVSTVSFNILLTSIPSTNAVAELGNIHYTYIVDKTVTPNLIGNKSVSIDVFTTTVCHADLISSKCITAPFADIGDTLTYNTFLTNTGTTITNGIIFIDTIPEGTNFIEGSLTQDGYSIEGNPNPPGITLNNICPDVTSTISFKVKVNSIPKSNSLANTSTAIFNYVVDPISKSLGTGSNNTNITLTTIYTAALDITQESDKSFSDIGDTITYTIPITNNGNTSTHSIIFTATIPDGTKFIVDSFYQDGFSINNIDSPSNVTLNNIPHNTTSTVTFKVLVNSIPPNNHVTNTANIAFDYVIDSTANPNILGKNSINSNISITTISNSNLIIAKKVDKSYVTLGNTLTYIMTIKNTGNTSTKTLTLIDTIPNGTSLVPNTLTQDGISLIGSLNAPGLLLKNIMPNSISTISFKLLVNSILSTNFIDSLSTLKYEYVVDSTATPVIIGNGYATSDLVRTAISNVAFSRVSQTDKTFVLLGDTITYNIAINNNGNMTTNSIIFMDTIPEGSTLVSDSFTQDGVILLDTPNPPGVLLNNIGPNSTSTISFSVIVSSIPSGNVLVNSATTKYEYIICSENTPSNLNEGADNTSISLTTVVNVALSASKETSTNYCTVGDILTYTIPISNNGNSLTNTITFIDSIPNGLTFVENSLTQDGVLIPGNPCTTDIALSNIPENTTSTLSYKALVTSLPHHNPVKDSSIILYDYIIDPTKAPSVKGTGILNMDGVLITISKAILSIENAVSKPYAQLGDTLTYNISMVNNGNTSTNMLNFIASIPNGLTFVPNSLQQDGINIPGSPNPPGITLNNIGVNQSSTISFKAIVTIIPVTGFISNSATIKYNFVVNPKATPPLLENNTLASNIAVTTIVNVTLFASKKVNLAYGTIGDRLNYTISINNLGNTSTHHLMLLDNIPRGINFVPGSLTQDGIQIDGAPTAPGIALNNIAPNTTSTICFDAIIASIPIGNVIKNPSFIEYDYIVDSTTAPIVVGSDSINTNPALTTVSYLSISTSKTVDKEYADWLTTLNYTLSLKSSGNITANTISIFDTIPAGVTFVPNSLKQDGLILSGKPLPWDLTLDNIGPNTTSKLEYQVVVGSQSNVDTILTSANTKFNYIIAPNTDPVILKEANIESNITLTTILNATLKGSKIASNCFATVGDKLTYTIPLSNIGTTITNSVKLIDNLPYGIKFVPGSLKQDGVTIPGTSLNSGISINNLSPKTSSTVTYDVIITSLPNINPISSLTKIEYSYIVSPSKPRNMLVVKELNTNIASTTINYLNINSINKVDKSYALVGDTLTYSIPLIALGTTTSNNLVFIDNLSKFVDFIDGSLKQDGVTLPGNPTSPGVILNNIKPNTISTISFQAIVKDNPSFTSIENSAITKYTYTIDPIKKPMTTDTITTKTNISLTTVVNIILSASKFVDKDICDMHEELTYIIPIKNRGKSPTESLMLIDTIPCGLTFVANSLTQDNINIPCDDLSQGIVLNNIGPNTISTVTFKARVSSVPMTNPICSSTNILYKYILNPNVIPPLLGFDSLVTNVTNTTICAATFDDVAITTSSLNNTSGDVITMEINVPNTGNTTAYNVVVMNTIPEGMTFIKDSITINGISIPGLSLQSPGLKLGTLPPYTCYHITYRVLLD